MFSGVVLKSLQQEPITGKLKNPRRYLSSKNKKIRDRVDSRVQSVWKLRVMGSWLAKTPGSSEVKIVRENIKFDHEQAKKPDKFLKVFE